MKKVGLILSALVLAVIIVCLSLYGYYNNSIKAVNKYDSDLIEFEVSKGDTYSNLSSKLKEKDLINSEVTYKIYLKLNSPSSGLKAGNYMLSRSMDVKTIVNSLSSGGKSVNPDEITITFKEGLNMRAISKLIVEKTNNKGNDVVTLLKDKKYLEELISEYWFIDKDILNSNIYYSLEGYLYPNTYNFKNKDVTVKEIFKVMLDETAKQIEPYKKDIIASKYNYHELLTLASVIELEALNESDRATVASVFYNRLNSGMQLGSDVTTYYASKVDMAERDLYINEINDVNAYNTRVSAMAGKLPVGPICNPSISSISAAIKPNKTDYYFFVADNKGKVYFTRNNREHEQTIAKLKSEGLWERY